MESGTVYPYRMLKLTWPSVAALLRDHAAERQSLCGLPRARINGQLARFVLVTMKD
jgi:hypothetical protein